MLWWYGLGAADDNFKSLLEEEARQKEKETEEKKKQEERDQVRRDKRKQKQQRKKGRSKGGSSHVGDEPSSSRVQEGAVTAAEPATLAEAAKHNEQVVEQNLLQ